MTKSTYDTNSLHFNLSNCDSLILIKNNVEKFCKHSPDFHLTTACKMSALGLQTMHIVYAYSSKHQRKQRANS